MSPHKSSICWIVPTSPGNSIWHAPCLYQTYFHWRKKRKKKEWKGEYGAKSMDSQALYEYLQNQGHLKENYYSVGRRRNQHYTLQNMRIKICFYKYSLTSYINTGSQMNTTVTETKPSLSILFHLLIYFSIQLDTSTNIFKTLNTWCVNPWLYLVRSSFYKT